MHMETAFETVRDRLEHGAVELFGEMMEAHLSASGDRFFIYLGGLGGSTLMFASNNLDKDWDDINGGWLEDLAGYGLLRSSYNQSGDPVYKVTPDGRSWYQWLRQQEGSAVEQAAASTVRLVESDQFRSQHPGAAHHLSEAFDLIGSDRRDDPTISEIGDHLRKAIMDLVSNVVPDSTTSTEKPAERLDGWLNDQPDLHDREKKALQSLVVLTRDVMRLDHRLNHIRDENDKGQPSPSYDEVRRAGLLTAVVCAEISRLV